MPTIPDLPCADCGKLMWRGTTSLPEGRARCQPCRRSDWQHGSRKGYRDNGCRCEECRGWNREQHAAYSADYRRRTGKSLKRKYQTHVERGSDWISPRLRLEIYARDDWTCWLCGEAIDPDLHCNDSRAASLDHVTPRSATLIPDHSPGNLRTAHRGCNSRRGTHEPERVSSNG